MKRAILTATAYILITLRFIFAENIHVPYLPSAIIIITFFLFIRRILMSIFMLSDPHLSLTADKPMDVFGARWENYLEKLEMNWKNTVGSGDTVVIPGDISWGMGLDTATEDLTFINALPGRKIIGKGNHDYWWQTMKKLTAFKEEIMADSIDFLFNNAYLCENFIISGTRGWMLDSNYSDEDLKIVNREAGRLRLSLEEAKKLKASSPNAEIVVFLHYPPSFGGIICRQIVDVMLEYDVKRCFYGHIHSINPELLDRQADGIEIFCVSADLLGFKPMKLNPLS